MTLQNQPVRHVPKEVLPDWPMIKERTRVLTRESVELPVDANTTSSCVFYWMQRDVRTVDNWALLLASHLAHARNLPLRVVYALAPPPSSADPNSDPDLPPALIDMPMTARHGAFLLGGLQCVHQELLEKKIPLHVVMADSHGEVGRTVAQLVLEKYPAVAVVADFSPLRQFREWMELQAAPLLHEAGVPLYQVDTHNVVPVWIAAPNQQVGARTLRPKIHKVVTDFLTDFPLLAANRQSLPLPDLERSTYEQYWRMDESVPPVPGCEPGTAAALKQFDFFVQHGLEKFDQLRNDPVQKHICSNLSPWVNHGHVSFQRLTMKVKKLNKYANGTKSYLEEGIIRRELSDNYVFYRPNDYDALSGAAGWAQETLQVHASDRREPMYTLPELERGETYDNLWNAAQLQVVREGQLHGFMRMYWAKKILEWTPSPEVALRTAQYLNDKYALDGKDPNGFVGVGWSIMGVHDQGWQERPVFGKIRYMNYNGCKRKFNIQAFVKQYPGAAENAAQAEKKPASTSAPASGQKRQAKLDKLLTSGNKKPRASK